MPLLYERIYLKKLNGFDEKNYPMYFEDVDLSFRVRKIGYKIVYQPKSIFKHYQNISTAKSLSKKNLFSIFNWF